METHEELDSPYEASDEASENELMERSLSVWTGLSCIQGEQLDLHTASSIGQYDCVRDAIKRGEEDLNRKNKGGWTALMYASYIGHDNIVNLLLEAGVSVNVKNNKGQTPLMLASSCGNESVAYFLLQAGAEIELRDKRGWTALFHATYSGHQDLIRFLLESGANAEAVEPSRHLTPLMEAAAAGHEIIVQYYLHHGVNVNARSGSGDTARSLAMINGHTKIVSLIDNHVLGSKVPLRAEPGLSFDGDFSSSDEAFKNSRSSRPCPRGHRTKGRGLSIREGPEAVNKMLEGKSGAPGQRSQGAPLPKTLVPKGYVTFTETTGQDDPIRSRDVTSPIDPGDHPSDSSGGKDSLENDEDGNAFSKTGALTIKSSSGSSGGLIAALGLSPEGSLGSFEELSADGYGSDKPAATTLQRSMSDSGLKKHAYEQNKVRSKGHGSRERAQMSGDPNGDNYRRSEVDLRSADQSAIGEKFMGEILSSRCVNTSGFPQYTQFGPRQGAQQATPIGKKPLNRTCSETSAASNKPYSPRAEGTPGTSTKSTSQTPAAMATGRTPTERCDGAYSRSTEGAASDQSKRGSKRTGGSHTGLSAHARNEQLHMLQNRPRDLAALLAEIGQLKYMRVFEDQDVDLQVFLSLTDNDLKEVGIKLLGPRRNMTNAIARWHSNAKPSASDLEQAYADKLEADMQEMAIQLHQATEQVRQLEQQVLQERELRSVTEGCLMEDRAAIWRQVCRLATEICKRCADVQRILVDIRVCQAELSRRYGATQHSQPTGSGSGDSLAAALHEGLSLDNNSGALSELARSPTKDIVHTLLSSYEGIQGLITMVAVNSEQLLGNDVQRQPQSRMPPQYS